MRENGSRGRRKRGNQLCRVLGVAAVFSGEASCAIARYVTVKYVVAILVSAASVRAP